MFEGGCVFLYNRGAELTAELTFTLEHTMFKNAICMYKN